MKRLNPININTPTLTNRIFEKRWSKNVQYIDWQRYIMMAKKFKGGRFLDIGVFNSPLIIELKRTFPKSEFIGLDYCEPVMRELQSRHPSVRYVVGDATALPFADEHFDYIVMSELIEHLEDPAQAIKEAMRVLKFSGTLAISTPKEEKRNNVSPEHLWSFTLNDIKKLLKPYGDPEISTYKDTIEVFVAYCKKLWM